jgi:tetratricopeptide (TPR) repeat protein
MHAPVQPDTADLRAQALACHRSGRLTEAEALYRRLLAADPHDAEALHLLGVAADAQGEPARAVELIGQALALRETSQFRCNLGLALCHLERHEAAAAACQRALALRPDYPEALNTLGVSLRALDRHDTAEQAYRQAVAVRPDYLEAWTNLAHLLHAADRLAEAETAVRRALALRPAEPGMYRTLAAVLDEVGRPHEALAVLDLAAGLDPLDAETGHHRALLLLSLGRFAEGFALYDHRFRIQQASGSYQRFATRPPWRGESLDGRTILLAPEQGFGDTIQFARYAPLVAARGGRVLLGAPRPLVRLLGTLRGVDQVVGEGEAVPPHDLHCPLMSLPHALKTTLETVPAAVPYLNPAPSDVARWAARLGVGQPGLRVGIVWAGNPSHLRDRQRSLPFAALAPLWQVPGVRWFSLQTGARTSDIIAAGAPWPAGGFIDLAPLLSDFTDTAAAMAVLDLVISVDTAAAHLAGALGRPVWMLVSRAADWRWLRHGDRSPWYPTLRLFRQDESRDWATLVRAVAEALRKQSVLIR